MSTYARETSVSVEKSRAELETTLTRYGCDCFGYMTRPGRAEIAFRAHDRNVRFTLPVPVLGDFLITQNHLRRSQRNQYKAWEQACRQRWRALCLAVKAKLEAVECGIATFEDEFLAYTVLPGGETVSRWLAPQLTQALANGTMPPLLQIESEPPDAS